MREVAIRAGLIDQTDHERRFVVINESLAASIYVQRELAIGITDVGDKYIICDAGSETIAVTSFTKTKETYQTISWDSTQLTADSNSECGARYIDIEMHKLLSLVLYNEDTCSESDIKKKVELERLLDVFISSDIDQIRAGKVSRE